jgi:hypothetical protein
MPIGGGITHFVGFCTPPNVPTIERSRYTVYKFVKFAPKSGPVSGSAVSRVGGEPIGLTRDTWPMFDGSEPNVARMTTRHLAVFAAIAALNSVACGKKATAQETPTTTAASATAPAMTTAAPTMAPAATTAAAAAGAKPALAATCTTKYRSDFLRCTEYYGKLPDKIEESCKKDDGTFVAGATPCPTATATGKCEHKRATAASSMTEVAYKTSPGDPKESCELLGNTWTPLTAAAEPKVDAKKKK